MATETVDMKIMRYLRRLLTTGTLIWMLTLTTSPVQAQSSVFEPAFLDGARTWCWEHDPVCSPVAHASISVAVAGLADWSGLVDGDVARWAPLGFYLAKEVYDHQRAGDRIPWHDHALDLGGAALGWWISGMLFGEDS